MKKIINIVIIGLFMGLTFSSCLDDKNDEEYQKYLEELQNYQQKVRDQYIADSILIVDYLLENDSLATIDDDYGFFYNIITPGGEKHPIESSAVSVLYKGTLLDGTVFDQTVDEEPVFFNLSSLITGWKLGIPLIGEGGKIILYLPSYYGYGTSEVGDIPENSVLIFEIELLEFI